MHGPPSGDVDRSWDSRWNPSTPGLFLGSGALDWGWRAVQSLPDVHERGANNDRRWQDDRADDGNDDPCSQYEERSEHCRKDDQPQKDRSSPVAIPPATPHRYARTARRSTSSHYVTLASTPLGTAKTTVATPNGRCRTVLTAAVTGERNTNGSCSSETRSRPW